MQKVQADMTYQAAKLMLFNACVTLLFFHNSNLVKAEEARSLLFWEGKPGTFIRTASSGSLLTEGAFSNNDLSAAVSVLLGLAPSSSIDEECSSKLNELLVPDPFHRPDMVFILTVQHTEPVMKLKISEAKCRNLAADSTRATLFVPEDMRLVSLDTSSKEELESEKLLHDLADFLGGSYLVDNKFTRRVLTFGLSNGDKISMDLKERVDQVLALELAAALQSIRKAVTSTQTGGLFVGAISIVENVGQAEGSITLESASKLLNHVVSKLFSYADSVHNGAFVGIVVNAPEQILDVKTSFGPSRLQLVETASDTVTSAIAEVLTETIIAYITGILFIVALLIAIWYLFNMPLTRDTLLYSGAKLD